MLFAMGPKRLDLLAKLVPNAERHRPAWSTRKIPARPAVQDGIANRPRSALGKTLIVVGAGN